MYKKILIPLDGSNLSECALEHAKKVVAAGQAAEAILLTVLNINLPPVPNWGQQQQIEKGIADQERMHQQIRREAREYLTQKSVQLKEAGIAVKTEILEEGGSQKAPDLILLYAKDNDVDLIVMSTHGRSGISRWAFGSVADKVAHYSKIPVLIITPGECRISG